MLWEFAESVYNSIVYKKEYRCVDMLLQQVVNHVWSYLFVSISANARPRCRRGGIFRNGRFEKGPLAFGATCCTALASRWLNSVGHVLHDRFRIHWQQSTPSSLYSGKLLIVSLFLPTSCCLFNRFRNRLYDKTQAFVRLPWFFRDRNESACDTMRTTP